MKTYQICDMLLSSTQREIYSYTDAYIKKKKSHKSVTTASSLRNEKKNSKLNSSRNKEIKFSVKITKMKQQRK